MASKCICTDKDTKPDATCDVHGLVSTELRRREYRRKLGNYRAEHRRASRRIAEDARIVNSADSTRAGNAQQRIIATHDRLAALRVELEELRHG